jgi:hypothetical protein
VKVLIPSGGPRKRYSELTVAEAINAAVDACAPDEDTRDRAVKVALTVLEQA